MAAEDRATFTIDLRMGGVTQVRNARASLAELQQAITGDIAALRSMQATLKSLGGNKQLFGAQIKQLNAMIAAQKGTIAQNSAAFLRNGGTMSQLATITKGAASQHRGLLDALKNAPGPLGRAARALSQVSFGTVAMAGAVVAGAAALLALGRAAAQATLDLIRFGIASADARRSELLHLEALGKIQWGWFGYGMGLRRAADSGSFLQDQIDKVANSVAIGRDKIAGFAVELQRAGMRGGNLQQALQGMAIVASTQGEEQAGYFKQWALGMALTGGKVKDLTDHIKAKLGGIAKQQMLSLNVQITKLRENLARMFGGIKIEAFLIALNELTQLLSLNTESGKALKEMFETLFTSLFGSVGDASSLFKDFFRDMIIGALELTLTLMDVRDWWRKAFGESDLGKWFAALNDIGLGTRLIKLLGVALLSAAVVAGALAVALGIVVVLLGLLVIGAAAVLVGIGLMVYGIAKLIVFLIDEFDAFTVKALKWGASLIDGLVQGIVEGTPKLIDAVKNLASEAWKGFKSKLGIASPSKLFRVEGGRNIAKGVELGVRDGAASVADATSEMTSPADVEAPTQGGGGARGGAQGFNVTFAENSVIVNGESSGQLVEMVQEAIRNAAEHFAINIGARAT